MKLISTLALLLTTLCTAAQEPDTLKSASVTMPVYYVKFIGQNAATAGIVIDVMETYRTVPVTGFDLDSVKMLLEHPELNKFNGIFLITTDDIIANSGIIANKNGRSPMSYKARIDEKQLSFSNFKSLPASRNYNRYAILKLTAVWKKFSVTEVNESNQSWIKAYMKKTPNADGKTYNYYFLDKIIEVESK